MSLCPALWKQIKNHSPLVHAISNVVTANDCANLLLAVGARPIMAQAPQEAGEITAHCHVTVLNIGTPSDDKFQACIQAGIKANALGHPVILDPVGIGASSYRRGWMIKLLAAVHPDLVRANLGEVQALLGQDSAEEGVDSPSGSLNLSLKAAKRLAEKLHCTVLLTGAEDIVTDGTKAVKITGGSHRLRRITGAGCMLSVLCGAAASETDPFTAAVQASVAWKNTAAYSVRTAGDKGLGHLHMALLDGAGLLAEGLEEGAAAEPLPME